MDVLRTAHHLPAIAQTVIGLCVWLLVLAVVFIPLERLFAVRRHAVVRAGFLADLGYFFLSGLVPGAVLSLPIAALAWGAHRLLPDRWTAMVAHWPLGMRVVAALVVTEIGLYWGHRWSHEIPLLWRFHVIHHSPTRLDWLVNTRAHPVDFVFTRFCGLVPLYALGFANPLGAQPSLVPLLVLVPGVAWGFFIHANLRWRFGPLEWLVATPAFHLWHHTNDGPDCIDKNYAPMLPWVDWLFGTFHLPKDRHPVRYGTDTPVPAGFVGQLLEPFAVGPREPAPAPPR
ncbi:MAG: sterol desaturase family protein [Acetobacteraceae bacterium]|nr:sterol desaturase family protein [Acetobacteraceae bacterium]